MKIIKTLKSWDKAARNKFDDFFVDNLGTVDVEKNDLNNRVSREPLKQTKNVIKEDIIRNHSLHNHRGPLMGETGSKKQYEIQYTLDLTGSTALDEQGKKNTANAFYKLQNKCFIEHLYSLSKCGEKIRVAVSCLRCGTVEVIKEFEYLDRTFIKGIKEKLNEYSPQGQTALTQGILKGDEAANRDTQKYLAEKLHVNVPIHIVFSDYESTENSKTIQSNLEKILEKEKTGQVINVFAGTESAGNKNHVPLINNQKISTNNFFIPFTNLVEMRNFFSIINDSINYDSDGKEELDYDDRMQVMDHMKKAIEESIDFDYSDFSKNTN